MECFSFLLNYEEIESKLILDIINIKMYNKKQTDSLFLGGKYE
ncbi:TPA: hypothetical protein ACGI8L_001690 [Clostridioides difficile]